ncbi:hypothetical protein [Brevibacillus brevis]|uniref:hypothetical protein n=1 Tax=Brevibacillus brevis TaxID=1393 RepID=UPI001C8EC146|nr:hypothetical protein [Brevibacillus brevis]MBY0088113.1 hypothetical protein [Brevibacillus brevis]
MAHIAKVKVQHNGKLFEIGDEIPGLKEEEAQRLLDLDAIEVEKKSSKGNQKQDDTSTK